MNRLILCIIVALLTATTVQGEVNTSTDPLVIMIDGNPASGQEFTAGDTITITCDVVASASINWSIGTIYNEASVDSALELYLDPVTEPPLISDTYYIIDTGFYEEGSVLVNETLSITCTLTEEGSYTIEAFSVAKARRYNGAWYTEGFTESGPEYLTFNVVDVLPVDIDIKPGSYPNSINLGSNGVVPVAILSSTEFDATQVDPDTVTLAGATVAVRGKGNKSLAHEEDVNDDGRIDLVCQVETENLDPGQFQDGYAILTGNLLEEFGGTPIEGSDEITIVPPE